MPGQWVSSAVKTHRKQLSIKNRTRAQAAKDRAALRRLNKSGTYRGKIDLRKAPTAYQLKKIAELAAKKRAGKKPGKKSAKAKKPLPPKQKVPGATIKRRRMSEKEVRNLKPKGDHKLVTYALPFRRKGSEEPEWRRFTRAQLTKFLNEYKADDPEERAEWRSYAVREEWTFATKTERTSFREETDLYFSGVRISEPQGGFTAVHANQHTKKKRAKKKRGARR
jgi:hypothetical protein